MTTRCAALTRASVALVTALLAVLSPSMALLPSLVFTMHANTSWAVFLLTCNMVCHH